MSLNYDLIKEIGDDFARIGFQSKRITLRLPNFNMIDVFSSLRGVQAKISGREFQFDKDGKVLFNPSDFTSGEECHLAFCLICWSICFTKFSENDFYVVSSVKNSDQYIQAIRKAFPEFLIDFEKKPLPFFIKDPLMREITKLESKNVDDKELGLTRTWQLIEHENKIKEGKKKSKKDEIRDILVDKKSLMFGRFTAEYETK